MTDTNRPDEIRVLSVDDHPLMHEGIAALIDIQPDMRLVAEAFNARQALAKYREHRPDVTLMDLILPDASGIDTMLDILQEFPAARVVMLTMVEGDAEINRALKDGAYAYLLKTMPPRAGRPLRERSIATMFYATRTGGANLAGGRNAREETVRLMRSSGLPFEGGLLPHHEPRYQAPRELTAPRIHQRVHTRKLRDAFVCIAPWGNHVLTYRVFEGLACRCLVLAQTLRDAAMGRALSSGAKPGSGRPLSSVTPSSPRAISAS